MIGRDLRCSQVSTPPTDQKVAASMRGASTTKPDHYGTRRGPIPADAGGALPQVSDCLRQSGRILQPGGLAVGEQVCQAGDWLFSHMARWRRKASWRAAPSWR